MTQSAADAEAELAAFRQRWREEVSSRNKASESRATTAQQGPNESKTRHTQSAAGPSTARRRGEIDYSEEVEPRAYHDLPDKEEQLKLGVAGQAHNRDIFKEPSSALEHYERAVEKETQGQLGDSINHYRKAFRVSPTLNHHVDCTC
jgi:F-box protein 9